ncbi:sigma factor-like helix-turn-helix DNA-binding protein [Sulfurimonas sp.]|jgi:DNA-directed RNA polymerase sigma subunit (sigma70/sigma32)|uniref:sigma factor-like helix-turn-helix DNA-binding protein n=1 Tax=Sulfurimonas sp. TaxID=2022749 RepID=UPI002A35AB1B|nr:sigma factor-like helix-turn-helix DNA-binding protein [Sulfurimonas sp.]MDY0122914.1 sigma factor-like helix-turn-helix DNA-binding protein [Sulfurimonas sp.]
MPELSKEQKHQILQLLLECHADIDRIHQRIDELQLQECTFSLREISRVLHISKERVRQLEVKALKKLRAAANDNELQEYLYKRGDDT